MRSGVWPDVDPARCGIPEYDDNPFISRLPPPPSDRDLFNALKFVPPCHAHERELEPHLREQLVFTRMRKLVLPTGTQVRQSRQIDLQLRSGYDSRNPKSGHYARRLTELAESDDEEVGAHMRAAQAESSAASAVAMGCSGIGKTTVLRRTLDQYPQVIHHTQPVTMRQIVWLRIDCPAGGSPKGLCLSFFEAVDLVVGTDYGKRFGKLAVDYMLVAMKRVAALHAIGLIAIDEIQHLRGKNVGREQLLIFLTSLVNIANIPILMIGTMAAYPIFTENFRIARRGEGIGSLIFEPLELGSEWSMFMKGLFSLQWTNPPTQISDELTDLLWEESQGVIDIAVKLFMLVQMKAIRVGKKRREGEAITAALIEQTAKESLRLVQPMLNALRRKDPVALAKYDDITSIDELIASTLQKAWGSEGNAPDLSALADRLEKKLTTPGGAVAHAGLAAALVASGLGPEQVEAMLGQVAIIRDVEDPLGSLKDTIKDGASVMKPRRERSNPIKQPPRSEDAQSHVDASKRAQDEHDIRHAAVSSSTATFAEALKENGVIQPI